MSFFGLFTQNKSTDYEEDNNKEISLEEKFSEVCIYNDKINEEYMLNNYDFFEIYDKNKIYEKNIYKAIFNDEIEREYKNIVFKFTNKNNEDIENNEIIYIVAKEIYNLKELEELENYCPCITCEQDRLREKLVIYKKLSNSLIYSLIDLLLLFSNSFQRKNIINYLEGYLHYPKVSCWSEGCIKYGVGFNIEKNVRIAREILKKDIGSE